LAGEQIGPRAMAGTHLVLVGVVVTTTAPRTSAGTPSLASNNPPKADSLC